MLSAPSQSMSAPPPSSPSSSTAPSPASPPSPTPAGTSLFYILRLLIRTPGLRLVIIRPYLFVVFKISLLVMSDCICSSQSRADLLTLGLAVTNILTGLVWLSIRPKSITVVSFILLFPSIFSFRTCFS